jgi:alkylation response protein AidB-like acyl-CoA dehydrogenase
MSAIARQAARVHGMLSGADAMLTDGPSPETRVVAEILVSVPAISIAGGTDEVQHNILGERILGLPKEPDDSRELPFRDVRRST